MARKKLKTVTRATISEVMQSIRDGKRTPAEGLMRLTTLTAASPLFMWLEYSDAVKEVLPMVQWNPEGEEVEILGELPIVWREPLDFYNWADHRMGLAFSTGQYLRDFIAEQDAEVARRLGQRAEAAIRAEKAQTLAVDPETMGEREIGVEGGKPGPGRGKKTVGKNENTNRFKSNRNDAAYRVAKLKRDHPEIIPRMAAGEFKSVAAAERAAKGEPPLVRKTPIYAHWNDPDEAAQCIRERLSEDQVALLKAKL